MTFWIWPRCENKIFPSSNQKEATSCHLAVVNLPRSQYHLQGNETPLLGYMCFITQNKCKNICKASRDDTFWRNSQAGSGNIWCCFCHLCIKKKPNSKRSSRTFSDVSVSWVSHSKQTCQCCVPEVWLSALGIHTSDKMTTPRSTLLFWHQNSVLLKARKSPTATHPCSTLDKKRKKNS